jgi:hypothetical protein
MQVLNARYGLPDPTRPREPAPAVVRG